ncbi:allantoinase PuuE [Streptomyces clavuligerus]|uniref:allantoinase PuuE n=1 Tax=Streptomyces clavuligerus TaxID=1901 RepID=UPI00017FFCBB|nr:allantoinase PuuE [Streptomyces clavuligerus]EDY49686.1 chitooligosaccharide deacetylase [Streptomyces clavuligerus]MBY6307407.1 allantoinase PuuE [Streptomyces clavuligerus]QCS10033.1 allantoinase PuuE [Streptomyces clavuligerus]QPJ97922.1 allantoinase PuuE [Streptomyces clavuligerus]WDN56739.1 allantoinase PuuE [Streptomyces clavuligerus]
MPEHQRDLVGHGAEPPHAAWPGGARVAVSLVLNYEEGGERNVLEGDPASEGFLHELVGAPPVVGGRDLNAESMFAYGSRAGFWRVHRTLAAHGAPLTVYAVGQALERNPEAARAMGAAGWEVAGHGWRWIDYREVPEETERADVARTVATIERLVGRRPVGWYTGRTGPNTRRLVAEEGGFLYDSDDYADDLPFYTVAAGRPHLVVPYGLDTNDARFLLVHGFTTAGDMLAYLNDTFDTLHAEGADRPRMMSVGLHCRIIGRPGRIRALDGFLDHVAQRGGAWITTREQIARHWLTTHPPSRSR